MGVLSPKVIFYLEHHSQIDEWANLRPKASDELHRWLCSWASNMRQDRPEEDIRLAQFVEGTTPSMLWYRDGWKVAEDGSKVHAGIGFEWLRNQVHERGGLYAGIWVHRKVGPDNNQALQNRLEDVVRDSPMGAVAEKRKWWPMYIHLDPIAQIIADKIRSDAATYDSDVIGRVLDSYRESQLKEARRLWEAFADHVDQAIGETVK